MENIQKIIDLLEHSIKENPENSLTAGGIIADGFDEKVDEYRDLVNNSKDWLANYQARLIKETGITSLRIKDTNISGYFIEITNTQKSKAPDSFVYKQTLVNASRYITLELKQFEEKFLEAENKKSTREYELFLEIREKVLENLVDIKKFAEISANIDFLTSLSQVAYENSYIKPKITTNYDLKILSGKHPVIMKSTPDFISNNLELTSKKFIHIITGPNMGGKSTFLRQNALIILMAHIGSFVPANEATIPLTDKIFSRIGANDNLYFGQSTFMVEMQEIANILNNSTKNSFVIIDEVGRGTSTYDGMSLAWAILKENHDKIKAKTLFATHFHELIDESKKLSGVENYSVAVGENDDNLIFLRKIIPGGIKKSFGIEVAKIAGLSDSVILEAKEMLRLLEKEHNETFGNQLSLGMLMDITPHPSPLLGKEREKNLSSSVERDVIKGQEEFQVKESELEKELEKIDVNNLTPIEALNELVKLKGKLQK